MRVPQERLILLLAVLAFIASAISVYFSYLDSRMDEIWQKEQIEALVEVVDSVEVQNHNLVEMVYANKEQLKISQETLLLAQQQLNELKVISSTKLQN
jgi:Na+-translocating ferredoxin:NAD+ oxidoreductase RnfG subunit